MLRTRKSRLSSVCVVAVSLVACAGHRVKLAAEGTGDVSNPPAPRGSPDEALVVACGDGAVSSGRLARRPYLQQITADSARILFTLKDEAPASVEVSRPDGQVVTELAATREAPGMPLSVRIQGLEPDTIHCYRLPGITERAGFRTAPSADSLAMVRFVAFGDSGNGSDNQRAVYAQMERVPYDLALHLGDLAYEAGKAWELEARFFSAYRRMTRSFAVFPVIGNHDNATEQALAYVGAFDLPDNGVAAERERFYSFDWGPLHVVALDTERIDAAQASWLGEDLQKNQRPWVVVIAHRPPYSSGEHGSNLAFRQVFGPVLSQHRVPLVLSGHDHDYERSRVIDGTVYVVSGGGGRDTRNVGKSDFTAYAEDVLHFLFVEADERVLTLHAIDGVGREFDSVRLQRP
jgi:hypothetical protein